MGNQPNIFKFATSELSQDAFICWLLSYGDVNHSQDEKLNKCAKEFVALLYNLKSSLAQIKPSDVETVEKPERQYCHTDVYFWAVINSKRVPFIIEDKTNTPPHSDQLSKYIEAIIEKDKIKKEDLIRIYYKTGYIFPKDEEEVKKGGYETLDYRKIHDFLQDCENYEIDNLIFESYKEYIKKDFYNHYENHKNLWQKDDYECFKHDFAQLEFMKKLSERCPKNIQYNYVGQERICNGKNRDGTPWTQLYFAEFKLLGEISENLFYRLDDKRKNPKTKKRGYYLSIRQYAEVKGNPEAKQKKLQKLKKYIEIFHKITKGTSLDFSNIRKDNSGHKESEVGTLFFDKDRHKPTAVLEQIGKIHEQFVKEI
jgi:hypothetical protein